MARYSVEFYSKHLARRVTGQLVIPSLNLNNTLGNKDSNYYQNLTETYPLGIFLCGFGDNQQAWLRNTSIDSLLEKNKMAGLFIDGENKWYLNHGPIEDFYNLIEEDLLDFVYGNFKRLSKDKPLVIFGVSMGGYGALYHYLTNVDKYAACVALSPATKPDFLDESKYGTLKEHFLKQKGKDLNIYLSIGDKDFIINESKEFNNFLLENKVGVEYKFIKGANHSWDTWKDEIYPVFDYLKQKDIIG